MYSRKSLGPRIEPRRTQALTGYNCEDFPSISNATARVAPDLLKGPVILSDKLSEDLQLIEKT